MGHRRAWGAAAAVAVASAVLVTLTPSSGTDAQWRDSATTTVSGPSSDTFGMTATGVPDDRMPVWTDGRWRNNPSVTLTNGSKRQSGWINVRSTRLTKAVRGDANPVLQQMAFDYTVGSGACGASSQSTYWQARGVGGITDGTSYPRTPKTKVAGATLAPGATATLCPLVRHNYATDSVAGQRNLILNHGGRAIDITTVVNQRSEAPATWASPDRTARSRYRLAMPAPVKPSDSDVCRRTFSSGNPSGAGYYGGFFWGWPDAATSDYGNPPSTPAMAGGWDIMRGTSNGGWEVWKSVPAGSERRSAGHNSRDIDPNRDVIREFKLRGYPFAGDKSRYVESAWIARAENDWSFLTDRWECHPPRTNPDAGPHNMP